MGVHGLWTLLEPVSKPIPLESLENKVLAIDVSIWLHQATKGFRDAQGNPLPNAHLLGLFHRILKLLFYRIKPIFVFDGGVPSLKWETLSTRNKKKEKALQNSNKLREKMLVNYIKSQLVDQALGKKKIGNKTPLKQNNKESDLFQLPPLPNELNRENCESEESEGGDCQQVPFLVNPTKGYNLHSVDFNSEEFKNLPPELQHDILLELKETRKQNSWSRIHEMPKESNDFSGFQVQRLLKRRNLQQRLDEVVKEISKVNHEQLDIENAVQSKRIASDSTSQYVLIKTVLEKSSVPKMSQTVVKQSATQLIEGSLCESSDDLTQEELIQICKTDKKPISSDSDSDFVEVLTERSTPDRSVFSVTVNHSLAYNKQDDIFADLYDSSVSTSNCSLGQLIPCSEIHFAEVEGSKLSSVNIQLENKFQETMENTQLRNPIPTPTIDICKVRNPTTKETVQAANDSRENIIGTSPPSISNAELPPKLLTTSIEQHSDVANNSPSVTISDIPGEIKSNSEKSNIFTERSNPFETDKDSIEEIMTDIQDEEERLALKKAIELSLSAEKQQELEQLENYLAERQENLIQERGKQERLGASITDQMYLEAQELLSLLGIPYLVAPMEAEAQCAFLDECNLTDGTITDDSDIWLFGGRKVYKNFFNRGKYVEYFEAKVIHDVFKLGREQLITMAILTGGDYTEGIETVGPVTALEILAEFPGKGLEALEKFRDWLSEVQARKNAPPENKIRQKIRHLQVKEGFPNRLVFEAYMKPEINSSQRKFTWAVPAADDLHDYVNQKFGWDRKKFNEVVLPVLDKFNTRETQTKIDSYFKVKLPSKCEFQISKRVMDAINKADFGSVNEFTSDEAGSIAVSQVRKRKQSVKTKTIKKKSNLETVATPSTSSGVNEIIWQKEKDRQVLEANKLKAIQVLKNLKRHGKRPVNRLMRKDAHLSDSDSDTESN